MSPRPPALPSDPLVEALAARVVELLEPRLAELVADATGAAPADALLTTADLCARLKCSKATVCRLGADGMPRVKVGSEYRYRWPDVSAWLAQPRGDRS